MKTRSVDPQQLSSDSSTAARLRGAGHEEKVPSRYELRIGDIDVVILSDGVFSMPTHTLVSNAEPADLAAWLGERFQSSDVYSWALNVLVVRSGDRTILIDSGIGAEYPAIPRAGGLLARRLEAAGIDPATITDVVITHLHMDHVGGLIAEDGLKGRLRPDVPIHLAAEEVAFWESPDFSRNTFGGMPNVIRSSEERFVEHYRSQLRPFEAERVLAPGVVVRRTGGHTPGHSVVRISSREERLTFLGDAVFPNHFDRPDWHNAFDHDPEEAVRVRVGLLRELAATRELLVAAHLSFPSLGRVARAGDAFRFVPANWEY